LWTLPQREWTINLAEGSRIVVDLRSYRSTTESFSVVLISEVEGEETCSTRYDTAHDQPHRDVLGRRAGWLEKEWMLWSENKDAFRSALADLRANYERYLDFYLQH
jgi:hypothetical protein